MLDVLYKIRCKVLLKISKIVKLKTTMLGKSCVKPSTKGTC